MRRFILGQTGIEVTELGFGALPMGPLQKDLDPESGSKIILRALTGGINFIDTAELYRTYEPIARALRQAPFRPVIASKSMATDFDGMVRALNEAREALGIDCIDIFHLHAARVAVDEDLFAARDGALQALLEARKAGRIRAVGVSTHSVPAVRAAARRPEIEVVFPLINKTGIGILHGDIASMAAAIDECRAAGKGVYLMKALGGGCLVHEYAAAIDFVRQRFSLPLALGMVSAAEVDYNLAWFKRTANDSAIKPLPPKPIIEKKNFQIVDFLCRDCGECLASCPNQAIARPAAEANPRIDPQSCLGCGYCVAHCPQFAIRMV